MVAGLLGGPRRASLVALLLWSGPGAHEVMLDWTSVASEGAAAELAQAVQDMPRIVRAGETAIGEALLAASALLTALPCRAARQVIDVVGDGRSNAGTPPGPVRDRLAAAGVTINGLCLLQDEPDLLDSYAAEVVGGPGSFVVPCPDYGAFAEAMRRKLIREIA